MAGKNAFYLGLPVVESIITTPKIMKLPIDQLMGIVAHELGHREHRAQILAKIGAISGLHAAYLTAALGLIPAYEGLYAALGFSTEPLAGAVAIAEAARFAVSPIIKLVYNYWAQREEFSADAFAASWGYGEGLKRGLVRIDYHSYGMPYFYRLFTSTHPSCDARMARIQEVEATGNSQAV